MLTTHEALPVLSYKTLEGVVEEPEFLARKNAKEVAVEIAKNPAQTQTGGSVKVRREHRSQHVAQTMRPLNENRHCRSRSLSCRNQIRSGERALLPAESVLFPLLNRQRGLVLTTDRASGRTAPAESHISRRPVQQLHQPETPLQRRLPR